MAAADATPVPASAPAPIEVFVKAAVGHPDKLGDCELGSLLRGCFGSWVAQNCGIRVFGRFVRLSFGSLESLSWVFLVGHFGRAR